MGYIQLVRARTRSKMEKAEFLTNFELGRTTPLELRTGGRTKL